MVAIVYALVNNIYTICNKLFSDRLSKLIRNSKKDKIPVIAVVSAKEVDCFFSGYAS
jgi:threonyl-tRNA synthetase